MNLQNFNFDKFLQTCIFIKYKNKKYQTSKILLRIIFMLVYKA